jgi:hypothetical protein
MMLGYADLFWKDNNLYRLGSKQALLSIVPDAKYPDIMWRVDRPDGSLSSMANRTRAKDAGMAMALQGLNGRMSRAGPAVARLDGEAA